jgi:hypothetical protein
MAFLAVRAHNNFRQPNQTNLMWSVLRSKRAAASPHNEALRLFSRLAVDALDRSLLFSAESAVILWSIPKLPRSSLVQGLAGVLICG